MRWSIKHEADGVITDNPKRFLEVCDEWEHGKRDIHYNGGQRFEIVWFNIMTILFACIFWFKFRVLPGSKPKRRPDPVRPDIQGAGPGVSMMNNKEDQ